VYLWTVDGSYCKIGHNAIKLVEADFLIFKEFASLLLMVEKIVLATIIYKKLVINNLVLINLLSWVTKLQL